MLAALEAFASGRITRGSALPTADLVLRKLAAIEALSRHGRATPAMLESIVVDAPRWPTSALLDWIGILQRVEGIPEREARRSQALSLLRSRLNLQGTVMTFSSEKNDALWWLMAGADVNANRALLAVLEEPSWREDMGRLVRGTLSRQVGGAWSTTVANAWGTVAHRASYGRAFEATPVTGATRAALAGERQEVTATGAARTVDFAWPATRGHAHASRTRARGRRGPSCSRARRCRCASRSPPAIASAARWKPVAQKVAGAFTPAATATG